MAFLINVVSSKKPRTIDKQQGTILQTVEEYSCHCIAQVFGETKYWHEIYRDLSEHYT